MYHNVHTGLKMKDDTQSSVDGGISMKSVEN